MDVITLRANAKVNLFLDVLERRPDGYHNIQSIFQFVSLCDKLELKKSDHNSFWCSDQALDGPDNLAVKAWQRLAEEYPVAPVGIRLEKHIPCMSGLGGGSADAAAVLKGLNQLFELNIPPETLKRMGSDLGADVPACLCGGALSAGGIGDKIKPLFQQKPIWFNIIKPQAAFSTAEMYRRLNRDMALRRETDLTAFMQAVAQGEAANVAAGLYNCFEVVAEPKGPIESARRLLLESGALGAAMSGSGSAVFGIYEDEKTAHDGYEMIHESGIEVYFCHSVQG